LRGTRRLESAIVCLFEEVAEVPIIIRRPLANRQHVDDFFSFGDRIYDPPIVEAKTVQVAIELGGIQLLALGRSRCTFHSSIACFARCRMLPGKFLISCQALGMT
jgi:hypothetical protein